MQAYDYAVIGGGIVGLAVAWGLRRRHPRARLWVLDKEGDWAAHQTGRNSGVIHSGIYYKPGSLKARLSQTGKRRMVEFCREHGIPCEVCGKVIIATEPEERPHLERLHERGRQHGLELQRLEAAAVREREPHVQCLEGLLVPSTGIVDFAAVCRKLAALLAAQGAELSLNTRATGFRSRSDGVTIETNGAAREARWVVNCAGLHCDRVARLAGIRPAARIVPFRGEYYELVPERRSLVRHLVYPVPNPAFPFLGVHYTRMIDGSVHAGPNAVLSLKREGYSRWAFNPRDTWETLTFGGFWRMAAKNLREGMKEVQRSFSKAAFVRSLQRMIPEVRAADLVRSDCGVRAQALQPDGSLVDDFLIERGDRTVHVLNAPSPAATASLEIGDMIAAQVPEP